jgi:hypothetical protein
MKIGRAKRGLAAAIAGTVMLLAASSSRSEDARGAVQGVVSDATGRPVAGAFVKLKNDERRLTFMVISRDQGRFEAKDLPPGQYRVQAIGAGFQSGWFENVNVSAEDSAKVGLALTAKQSPRLGRSVSRRRTSSRRRRTRRTFPKAKARNSSPRGAAFAMTCCVLSLSAPTRKTGLTPSSVCAGKCTFVQCPISPRTKQRGS